MIKPMYHSRPMEEIKKYPNFILFRDSKTGVKQSFTYEQLNRTEEKPKRRWKKWKLNILIVIFTNKRRSLKW